MNEHTHSNRLAASTSPYLLQHADNPVDWWPWCPEALELARREDKPILLSIGYSACHWCHVMAHESFEDPDTAAVMNRLFVNIKVDREERPDLDKIYQTAHQLLARRAGGWPLTVFLTPDDHKPFFAGTYFPPAPRHGMPAFTDLLQRVEQAYREQLPAIREQNQALMEALARLEPTPEAATVLDDAPIRDGERQFAEAFDERHGGFGGAPKFPHPSSLEFLLRRWEATGDAEIGRQVRLTLERMAAGGVNDQLGGGFCRYSVDEQWMIPHFEKMLYDNGPLLCVYALAWAAAGRHPVFAHACRRTAEWALREMRSPDGGFYSSLDADSEGEEGLFYVWSRDEVREALNGHEYAAFAPRFGLDRDPNFEGRWHLHTYTDTPEIAERLGLEPREVRRLLSSARDKLMARRERRVRPGRDEKILTSWNALMAGGLARAGRLLEEPTWVDAAGDALDFLRRTHWRDGRLLATSKDGRAHLPAYLDDHAFLIDALLEMLQARWVTAHLEWALELAGVLLAHFEDAEAGGFYFTADDHEALVHRPKGFADESVPAGNGVAATALLRLGHLVGDVRLVAAAERTLRAGREAAARLPYAHPSLLIALEEYLAPPAMLVVSGPAEALSAWRSAAARHRWPGRLDFFVPDDAGELPGLLASRRSPGTPRAYLCRGTACEAPVDELDRLIERLAEKNRE